MQFFSICSASTVGVSRGNGRPFSEMFRCRYFASVIMICSVCSIHCESKKAATLTMAITVNSRLICKIVSLLQRAISFHQNAYHKSSNRSHALSGRRASNTGRGSEHIVLIEAMLRIEADPRISK